MDKRKSFPIVFLLLCLVVSFAQAQKLTFNSQKKTVYALNQDVADALLSNNASKLDRLLTKDPKSVNCGVGQNCPLLYKAVEMCLDHKVSTEMVKVVLKHHPDYYCLYNKESPFYCILRYLATHPINTCETAESLFYQFYNLSDFNVLEVFDMTPPPLAFLLNTNHEFLKGRFDHTYINSEIVIALVEKGASVNSRDRNSSTLMAYATECKNQTLIDFCLGKNVDLNVKNKQGLDPFCIAVRDNQLSTVKQILKSGGYSLNEDKIANTALKTILPNTSQEVIDFCFNHVKSGVKNIQQLRVLKQAFPKNFEYYITNGFNRGNLNVPTSDLPDLISMFDYLSGNQSAQANLKSLKSEYVHSAADLAEFNKFLKLYPIYSLDYTKDYYTNENKYEKLKSSLKVIQKDLPSSLYTKLTDEASSTVYQFINEDKASVAKYVEVLNGYKTYLQENPEKVKEIEKKAYIQHIRHILGYPQLTYRDYYNTIKYYIDKAENDAENCRVFIQHFSNTQYIADAKIKLDKAIDYANQMKDTYQAAINHFEYLTSQYEKFKTFILKEGNTPPYSISENEITIHLNWIWKSRSMSDDLTLYFKKSQYGEYEISEQGLLGSSWSDRDLNTAVRRCVFESFCKGNYIEVYNFFKKSEYGEDEYYTLRAAVEFLQDNYKKNWWLKRFGDPFYNKE